jgi:hypothetical protein
MMCFSVSRDSQCLSFRCPYGGVPQVDNPTSLENIETKVSIYLSKAEIIVHSFPTPIQPKVA